MSGLKVVAACCILVFVAIVTCFIGEFLWIYGDVPSLADVLKQKDVYSPNDLFTFRMDDKGNQTKIPPIIHQTWKDMDLSTYPNYNSHFLWSIEYEMRGFSLKLWTDNAIYDLIKTHYPTLKAAYNSLPYDIQRADLARYLILYHEGGYYADLDTFPNALSINDFSSFNLVIPRSTESNLISNHFLGAEKHSHFLFSVINDFNSTKKIRDRNSFFSPYLQVFATSGPFFLQKKLVNYLLQQKVDDEVVFLVNNEISKRYFYHIAGRSWHQLDGTILNFIGDNPLTMILWIFIGIIIFRFRRALYGYFSSFLKVKVIGREVINSSHLEMSGNIEKMV